jgi:glycerophosphoryl diester phosphodiesterase
VAEKKNKDVFLNLEIKTTPTQDAVTPDNKSMVSLILKDIQKFELEDRIVVTSYDFRNLYELKKQNSNVLRGFITLQQDLSTTKKNVYEGSPWMAKTFPLEDLFLLPNLIKSLEGHVWSVFYRDLTKQNVELAHKHGLAVNVWTVNREKDIIKMIDYGVDGIITDYPKKVQDICKLKNIEWF